MESQTFKEIALQKNTIYADIPISDCHLDPRDRVGQYVALRAQYPTATHTEIAEKIGISRNHLSTLVNRAVREGWLVFSGPADRLEHEIVPQAMDNVAHFIKKQDKAMTIEVMKGAGIFKTHQAIRTETTQPQTVLALKIDMTPATELQVVQGNIVGMAREG